MQRLPGDGGAKTVLKAVVVGETEVGKTSLCNRYYLKKFDPLTATTISASCIRSELVIEDEEVLLCVWDTAGQERFRSISPLYYRGSHVALIVIDLTNAHSLESAELWVKELREKGPPEIPLVVLGNKADLKERISISAEAVRYFTEKVEAEYIQVSALNGTNVDEAFSAAAVKALHYYRKISHRDDRENEKVKSIQAPAAGHSNDECC